MSPILSVRKITAALLTIFCFLGAAGCGGSNSSGNSSPPPPPSPKYTIAGTVSGLAAGSSITLQFQGGSATCTGAATLDTLTVTSDGSFISNVGFPSGECYQVTVPSSAGQQCTLSGASGTVGAANITNVEVTCRQLSVVWLFHSTTAYVDGANALSLVQGTDGNFYGTTAYGGTGSGPTSTGPSRCPVGMGLEGGCGTVFRVTPAGAETVLRSFGTATGDGLFPGALIEGADGNFYGNAAGGANGGGIIFKIAPDGTYSVVWTFGGSGDGSGPSPLIEGRDGNFYGATGTGDAYGYGGVFRLTPAGVETILWSFGGYRGDGSSPGSLLLGADGNLYGTTSSSIDPSGARVQGGTIFELTTAGAESVLWTFGQTASDGTNPTSLIEGQDGNLYGTTSGGGSAGGGGTIFELSLSPVAYKSLAAFSTSDVLANPSSLMQAKDGNFYGVTNPSSQCGSIFELTPGGSATAIWTFANTYTAAFAGTYSACQDGIPSALIQGGNGNLYGTTAASPGSLFKLTP